MNWKETLFCPGWWKFAIGGAITGVVLAYLTGCTTPVEAEPSYPQYDRWWTQSVNTNSLEGLGQGDVYVHEYVTTNFVLGADGLRREIVTNRTEAVLL